MCAVKIGRLGKFDLNPRGELWRKDQNRFGHKLLSKFGWSQGKGLGKNEDGIAENLKVRMKMGNTGVGWDEKIPVGIDYREFDAVLEDLNKRYQKPGEGKSEEISLEKRSQQFKNRIHYQKFVRGKDISRYSKKDMSSIFLSRESEEETEPDLKESSVTNIESRPADIPSGESMPTFNSQLSMADYFAMKMKNKVGPNESKTLEESSHSETNNKGKKRKNELKSSKRAKRMKIESELSTSKENLCYEDDTTESSGSSEEVLNSEEQFQNAEESSIESVKIKKKMSKKKKLLNAFKSKEAIENDVAEKNLTENLNGVSGEKSSVDESSCITSKDVVTSKKRKKDQKSFKRAKKCRLEDSTSLEKNLSHSESDYEEKNSSEESTTKTVKTEKQSHKKHKSKLLNLKSCLRNNKYSFKEKRNVSFCENISYKIIENVLNLDSDIVLETNEQLLPCSDEDCTDNEIPNEKTNDVMNHVEDSNFPVQSTNGDVQCDSEDVSYDENLDMAEESVVPECFKLPKCSSKNYDSWLETQRIAARMKVYKNMAKKMKKHPNLRTTNLLEIKGYGNWGF